MSVYDKIPTAWSSFTLFREPPWPSYWGSHITPWQFYYEGITMSAVYVFILIMAVLFLPTFDLRNPRIRTSLLIFFGALYVSYSILPAGIFGYSWCTGTVESRMPLAFGSDLEVKARVGLHVGILGVNITMEGLPREQANRTIYYVEHFPWSNPWGQHRMGFGKYAGHLARTYRERQEHGVPTPIQWVAEYFWADGERIRWGRNYRQGAHYAFIILRTCAVGVAIILAIFLTGALTVGSWLSFILGSLIISAAVTFIAYTSSIWNHNPLIIPFRDANLTCQYGASLYNCLACGILCILASALTDANFLSWWRELYGDNFEEAEPHAKFTFGRAGGRGFRGFGFLKGKKVDEGNGMEMTNGNGSNGFSMAGMAQDMAQGVAQALGGSSNVYGLVGGDESDDDHDAEEPGGTRPSASMDGARPLMSGPTTTTDRYLGVVSTPTERGVRFAAEPQVAPPRKSSATAELMFEPRRAATDPFADPPPPTSVPPRPRVASAATSPTSLLPGPLVVVTPATPVSVKGDDIQ